MNTNQIEDSKDGEFEEADQQDGVENSSEFIFHQPPKSRLISFGKGGMPMSATDQMNRPSTNNCFQVAEDQEQDEEDDLVVNDDNPQRKSMLQTKQAGLVDNIPRLFDLDSSIGKVSRAQTFAQTKDAPQQIQLDDASPYFDNYDASLQKNQRSGEFGVKSEDEDEQEQVSPTAYNMPDDGLLRDQDLRQSQDLRDTKDLTELNEPFPLQDLSSEVQGASPQRTVFVSGLDGTGTGKRQSRNEDIMPEFKLMSKTRNTEEDNKTPRGLSVSNRSRSDSNINNSFSHQSQTFRNRLENKKQFQDKLSSQKLSKEFLQSINQNPKPKVFTELDHMLLNNINNNSDHQDSSFLLNPSNHNSHERSIHAVPEIDIEHQSSVLENTQEQSVEQFYDDNELQQQVTFKQDSNFDQINSPSVEVSSSLQEIDRSTSKKEQQLRISFNVNNEQLENQYNLEQSPPFQEEEQIFGGKESRLRAPTVISTPFMNVPISPPNQKRPISFSVPQSQQTSKVKPRKQQAINRDNSKKSLQVRRHGSAQRGPIPNKRVTDSSSTKPADRKQHLLGSSEKKEVDDLLEKQEIRSLQPLPRQYSDQRSRTKSDRSFTDNMSQFKNMTYKERYNDMKEKYNEQKKLSTKQMEENIQLLEKTQQMKKLFHEKVDLIEGQILHINELQAENIQLKNKNEENRQTHECQHAEIDDLRNQISSQGQFKRPGVDIKNQAVQVDPRKYHREIKCQTDIDMSHQEVLVNTGQVNQKVISEYTMQQYMLQNLQQQLNQQNGQISNQQAQHQNRYFRSKEDLIKNQYYYNQFDLNDFGRMSDQIESMINDDFDIIKQQIFTDQRRQIYQRLAESKAKKLRKSQMNYDDIQTFSEDDSIKSDAMSISSNDDSSFEVASDDERPLQELYRKMRKYDKISARLEDDINLGTSGRTEDNMVNQTVQQALQVYLQRIASDNQRKDQILNQQQLQMLQMQGMIDQMQQRFLQLSQQHPQLNFTQPVQYNFEETGNTLQSQPASAHPWEPMTQNSQKFNQYMMNPTQSPDINYADKQIYTQTMQTPIVSYPEGAFIQNNQGESERYQQPFMINQDLPQHINHQDMRTDASQNTKNTVTTVKNYVYQIPQASLSSKQKVVMHQNNTADFINEQQVSHYEMTAQKMGGNDHIVMEDPLNLQFNTMDHMMNASPIGQTNTNKKPKSRKASENGRKKKPTGSQESLTRKAQKNNSQDSVKKTTNKKSKASRYSSKNFPNQDYSKNDDVPENPMANINVSSESMFDPYINQSYNARNLSGQKMYNKTSKQAHTSVTQKSPYSTFHQPTESTQQKPRKRSQSKNSMTKNNSKSRSKSRPKAIIKPAQQVQKMPEVIDPKQAWFIPANDPKNQNNRVQISPPIVSSPKKDQDESFIKVKPLYRKHNFRLENDNNHNQHIQVQMKENQNIQQYEQQQMMHHPQPQQDHLQVPRQFSQQVPDIQEMLQIDDEYEHLKDAGQYVLESNPSKRSIQLKRYRQSNVQSSQQSPSPGKNLSPNRSQATKFLDNEFSVQRREFRREKQQRINKVEKESSQLGPVRELEKKDSRNIMRVSNITHDTVLNSQNQIQQSKRSNGTRQGNKTTWSRDKRTIKNILSPEESELKRDSGLSIMSEANHQMQQLQEAQIELQRLEELARQAGSRTSTVNYSSLDMM